MKNVTVYFLKAIVSGEKKRKCALFVDADPTVDVKMSRVAHVSVPHYENLTLEQIVAQLEGHPEVFEYLPDGKELQKVPRQWICNLIATIVGRPFVDWVKTRVKERNAALVKQRNLGIAMDPEIAAAFHASTAVSVSDSTSLTER